MMNVSTLLQSLQTSSEELNERNEKANAHILKLEKEVRDIRDKLYVIEKEHKDMLSVSSIIKTNNLNTKLEHENTLLMRKIKYLQERMRPKFEEKQTKEIEKAEETEEIEDTEEIEETEETEEIEETEETEATKEAEETEETKKTKKTEESYELLKIKKDYYWIDSERNVFNVIEENAIGDQIGKLVYNGKAKIIRD
jgi:uncharacterized protein YchJ